MSTFDRRDFIKSGGIIAAGLTFLPACVSKMIEEYSWRFFTKDESVCAIALCEQIIPGDDKYGVATNAGFNPALIYMAIGFWVGKYIEDNFKHVLSS